MRSQLKERVASMVAYAESNMSCAVGKVSQRPEQESRATKSVSAATSAQNTQAMLNELHSKHKINSMKIRNKPSTEKRGFKERWQRCLKVWKD